MCGKKDRRTQVEERRAKRRVRGGSWKEEVGADDFRILEFVVQENHKHLTRKLRALRAWPFGQRGAPPGISPHLLFLPLRKMQCHQVPTSELRPCQVHCSASQWPVSRSRIDPPIGLLHSLAYLQVIPRNPLIRTLTQRKTHTSSCPILHILLYAKFKTTSHLAYNHSEMVISHGDFPSSVLYSSASQLPHLAVHGARSVLT